MKKPAKLNRTLQIDSEEITKYKSQLVKLDKLLNLKSITNKIINEDLLEVIDFLPEKFVDLLFIDPPYNLPKKFNLTNFKEMNDKDYEDWIDSWLSKIVRLLKPNASIYICSDWRSSNAIYNVTKKYFKI